MATVNPSRVNPIHVFNRILLLLLGALAVVAGIIVLLLLLPVIHPRDVSPGGFLQAFWQGIANLAGAAATAAVIGAILLALIGLALIVIELLPAPREEQTYVVRKDGLGTVTVARKSVRQVVQYEAAQIEGVREVHPEVSNGADGLHIVAHASLAPDAAAPAVGEELQVTIKEAVQRHLGLPVAEVQIHTQVQALDTRRRVR